MPRGDRASGLIDTAVGDAPSADVTTQETPDNARPMTEPSITWTEDEAN